MKQYRILWSIHALVFFTFSHVLSQMNGRNEVIQAEYHFAGTAAASNTKKAFLAHLAPDGLVVQEGSLVNGIQDWKKRKPNESLLSWYPTFVDVARSGEMGVSTGPWEYRRAKTDSSAVAWGHFISLWKKQSDGGWKVFLDVGVSHAKLAEIEQPLERPSRHVADVKGIPSMRSSKTLLDLEKSLMDQYRGMGPNVLAEYISEDVRVYRSDAIPLSRQDGKNAILDARKGTLVFSTIGGEVASSGDWAYTYGSVTMRATERETGKGVYLRVWKKNMGFQWKIVLEVIGT